MAYTEVIPEYLYEFDNYADAEFEYLSLDQYNTLVKIIPQNDADLNSLMNSIRDIIWEYCYVDIDAGAPASSKHVMSIVKILNKHSLNLPELAKYSQYSFDANSGWGDFIKREEYL